MSEHLAFLHLKFVLGVKAGRPGPKLAEDGSPALAVPQASRKPRTSPSPPAATVSKPAARRQSPSTSPPAGPAAKKVKR